MAHPFYKLLLISVLSTLSLTCFGQFGFGGTFSNDLYNRFTNPKDDLAYRSSGNLLLNFAAGPKVWIGSPSFSVSAEALAGIGLTSLAVKDYKGLGSAFFPMMVKLNFGGLTTLDKEGKTGFSIGGGIQYARTELYGLSSDYEEKGVIRGYFKNYLAQVSYGFGLSGFAMAGNIKYGWNSEDKSSFMAIGIQYDFNVPMLNKISNPSNEL